MEQNRISTHRVWLQPVPVGTNFHSLGQIGVGSRMQFAGLHKGGLPVIVWSKTTTDRRYLFASSQLPDRCNDGRVYTFAYCSSLVLEASEEARLLAPCVSANGRLDSWQLLPSDRSCNSACFYCPSLVHVEINMTYAHI